MGRRLAETADRWRYAAFVLLAGALSALIWQVQHNRIDDFYYFVYGGRALIGTMPDFHAGALHLYALTPEIQIGPLPLLANSAISWLPVGVERAIWIALIMLCGLFTVRTVEKMWSVAVWQRFVHGFVIVGAYAMLAWWSHLDDAMALTGIAIAMSAIARRRPWWLPAVALGLAAMCKPWAIVAAPMLLALSRRDLLRAGAVYAATAFGPWLPFILADHRTLSALGSGRPQVNPSSALRLLGLHVGATVPGAVHTFEILLGLAVGALVFTRNGWIAVPFATLATRMLVEPLFFPYYGSGPVIAALIWDVTRRHKLPWWALSIAGVEYGPAVPHIGGGILVAVAQVGLAAAVLGSLLRRRQNQVTVLADEAVDHARVVSPLSV